MKYFVMILFLIGFLGLQFADGLIYDVYGLEQNKPQIEITPTIVRYGDIFTIHAWLDSYEKPDELRYYIDVFDENNRQVDSTLWFARQDFVYEFDTTHPSYNITKGGTYLIKAERANNIERTGIIETTLLFEIVDIFPPPLKQITSGIKFHNVQCNDGLVLAERGTERSACVKLDTKIELIVRGWAYDDRIILGCLGDRVKKCYPEDKEEYRKALRHYYYGIDLEPEPESLLAQFEIIANENIRLQDERTLKAKELDTARANQSATISTLEVELSVIDEKIAQNEIKLDEIRNATSKFYEIDSQLKATLEEAQQILTDNHDIIPWNGLGIDYRQKALSIQFEDEKTAEESTPLIKKLIGEDVPIIIAVGQNSWDAPPPVEPESQSTIQFKAKQLGIDNIMEAIDSEELSYDEKLEYIKNNYEKDGLVTTPSLNLRIKDLTRNLEYGQLPTFTLIEAGYANPCTAPKLEVYFIKEETGHDLTNDELIFEHRLVYSCTKSDKFSPVLNYWSEKDFPSFPVCDKKGRYLIVGDSGTERVALDEYYCNPK